MQHFFTEIINWKIKDERVVYQLWRVLRWKIWDSFFILDWKWWRDLYEITGFSKKDISVKKIVNENFYSLQGARKINLFFAIPKSKEKFEFIIQKWTELWVSEFHPVITDFSQGKYPFKKERFDLICMESAEQSERIFLPKLFDFKKFEEVFDMKLNGLNLFFHSRWENQKSQFDILQEQKGANEINLFIWAEWWFSDNELSSVKEKWFEILTLWEGVLRMETAVIVALGRVY